jgi:hypothetical protein
MICMNLLVQPYFWSNFFIDILAFASHACWVLLASWSGFGRSWPAFVTVWLRLEFNLIWGHLTLTLAFLWLISGVLVIRVHALILELIWLAYLAFDGLSTFMFDCSIWNKIYDFLAVKTLNICVLFINCLSYFLNRSRVPFLKAFDDFAIVFGLPKFGLDLL